MGSFGKMVINHKDTMEITAAESASTTNLDAHDCSVTYYEFSCPECGFDHEEAGRLATEREIYCGVCAGDCGRDVLLSRRAVVDQPKIK
jgi:hypothetical protein